MGHFYTAQGEPRHTFITATGKNKGKERPTTIRDARKHGLYASVTTILKPLKGDALLYWHMGNVVEACLDSPMRMDETLEEYKARVIDLSGEKSKIAREFGTAVHAHAEALAGNRDYIVRDHEYGQRMEDTLLHVRNYLDYRIEKVLQTEFIEVCPYLGTAGTIDLSAVHREVGPCLIDFKTQKIPEGGTVKFYDEFCIQLALYAEMKRLNSGAEQPPRIVSVVIPSREPAPCIERIWTENEQKKALRRGKMCAMNYHVQNDYVPRGCELLTGINL